MKNRLFLLENICSPTVAFSAIRKLIAFQGLIFFLTMIHHQGNAQCSQNDIVITTNTTWTNQDVQLTDNQKIIVTGATLTLNNCILRRKIGCTGYWDGIYLETADLGAKAGLIVNNGSRIEFSRNGIQALDGFSEITLDNIEMSDNGRMILARDNWPFTSFSAPSGGFTSNSNGSRGGEPISVYDIGCDIITSSPPKVTIDACVMKVTENGNASVDPGKFVSQINCLGAELQMVRTEISNGQSTYVVLGVAASRGKCYIRGSAIDGFWYGIYKGTDAAALCSSEGLVLTGSRIVNVDLNAIFFNAPGGAVYNISSDAFIRANILESNVWSFGSSYGNLIRNNIYNGHDEDVTSTSVFIVDPEASFMVYDNRIGEMYLELDRNNSKTYVTCNVWDDQPIAFVGGLLCEYPMSWGTLSQASGNGWVETKSEMYNLSSIDSDLDYYYRFLASETFFFFDGIDEHVTTYENTTCTHAWPTLTAPLDTNVYFVDMEDLEDKYDSIQSEIGSIIGHMDTSLLSVKEELAYLRSLLDNYVGQGLLFHEALDSGYWTNEVDIKVIELLGLNYLWYGMDMYSITEHLYSNTDPDAEALYDAAVKMSEYFEGGKNLSNLSTLQVDTLQTIAESSFGNYTNILRNYLFMMYDVFIPWEIENPRDSILRRTPLVQQPIGNPVASIQLHTVAPNPFTDDLQIQAINSILEEGNIIINVYDIQGVLLNSSVINGNSGRINLNQLESGIYILSIRNPATGSIETKRIYKDRR